MQLLLLPPTPSTPFPGGSLQFASATLDFGDFSYMFIFLLFKYMQSSDLVHQLQYRVTSLFSWGPIPDNTIDRWKTGQCWSRSWCEVILLMKFGTATLIQRHLAEFVEDLDPWSFPYVCRYLIRWIEIQGAFTWDSFALVSWRKICIHSNHLVEFPLLFPVLSNVHLNSCSFIIS